jgi:hypothetical protein
VDSGVLAEPHPTVGGLHMKPKPVLVKEASDASLLSMDGKMCEFIDDVINE